MYKHFITLEKKSFWRSASLSSEILTKILAWSGKVYVVGMMILASFIGFKYIDHELCINPLDVANTFLIYWFIIDLILRFIFQKMPMINIKPLLILPINKKKIIFFALGKTLFSFFNFVYAFFFIPFSILLIVKGNVSIVDVLFWNFGLIGVVFFNNFFNILLNKKNHIVYIFALVILILGSLQYYEYFNITQYTAPFFEGFYLSKFLTLLPVVLAIGLFFLVFAFTIKDVYLDTSVRLKSKKVKTESLDWLNTFGRTAIFLKNDIKLIKRNKRAKATVVLSVIFLFYGLLFFPDSMGAYKGPFFGILAGVLISGGFLLNFGQLVPSWDSSYYPLMMTQNIRYKEYLASKWWLMVLITGITTILGSGYLYFGWEAYLSVIVGAIFNMGVNSHIILLSGAFTKTPIDLMSSRNVFGDMNAINVKTLTLSMVIMVLPIVFYAIGHVIYGPPLGYVLVSLAGIAGLAFRNLVFDKIEKVYKSEKYVTIDAYKQKK
ncbi:DUF5687 family protein [Aquimarina addita]